MIYRHSCTVCAEYITCPHHAGVHSSHVTSGVEWAVWDHDGHLHVGLAGWDPMAQKFLISYYKSPISDKKGVRPLHVWEQMPDFQIHSR